MRVGSCRPSQQPVLKPGTGAGGDALQVGDLVLTVSPSLWEALGGTVGSMGCGPTDQELGPRRDLCVPRGL